MNYRNSLLALLLVGCSSVSAVNFNPENQNVAQEMFCRAMNDLRNCCVDASMVATIEEMGLEKLQNDIECVDLACQMARMMREANDCSLEMVMNAFNDVDTMKVMAAYALCQSCMADLMPSEQTNC